MVSSIGLSLLLAILKKKGEKLTAFDKTVYTKRSWAPYESIFFYRAQNEKIARQAISFYETYLLPYLKKDKELDFYMNNWIWYNYPFIISDILDPIR